MSYEGYGVRARKDLSANIKLPSSPARPLTALDLVKAAQMLTGLAKTGEEVRITASGAARLADALLAASDAMSRAPKKAAR